MVHHASHRSDAKLLRQRAEEIFKTKPTPEVSPLSESDMLKLIHELEVHQIELAMQNEELVQAKLEAEENLEKYTEYYELAPSGYLTLTKEGKILASNFRVCQMLEVKRKELLNTRIDQFLPPEEKEIFEQFLNKVFIHLRKNECEISFTTKKNKILYTYLTGIVSANKSSCLITIVDMSERKKADMELEVYYNHLEELVKARTNDLDQANKYLAGEIEKEKNYEIILQESLMKEKDLNDIKTRFIATTSHEFRTPLTSVLTSAELLIRYGTKWSDEKKNEHLERIIRSVRYLANLLDDILILSRTQSGEMICSIERIDFKNLVAECVADARSLMNNKHKLKLIYKPRQKEFLLSKKFMKFILYNLLSNAIKYSPEGGTIELAIAIKERFLLIDVSDEGMGIPLEEIDKIFHSFYRTKNAEDISGNGLGLAIVKQAVDLHKGEIKVKSEVNEGTTFSVKIPVLDSDSVK